MGMARTMTIPYATRAEVRPPAFVVFFSKLLSPVRDLFVKPARPDVAFTLSEITRVHALILKSPRDKQLGRTMHSLVTTYEDQTRKIAMRNIREIPKLKARILAKLREDREHAHVLAFKATQDPFYGSKLENYDWKKNERVPYSPRF
ncbi:MAG: hypothetical protein Q7T16_01455 [Candidatus Burarchaeum sp.]|nr:hypothetical protein [Candidatus Burarchaeum sp.]MDO8339303.1 hypothetical protein [Candidatus Burarchaeum sp.]